MSAAKLAFTSLLTGKLFHFKFVIHFYTHSVLYVASCFRPYASTL